MKSTVQADAAVQFERDAVRIHGKPELLLCASLFYFRIPRAYWKERMEQLAAFGYNAIDVYFPWNYHERSEGSWDFEGERDVVEFLAAAKDTGLWVVARPGPYICSEWDGGALPAYLLADDDIRLRDNDPVFLQAVSRWFDRILPVIRAYEAGKGGTVIALQLDNELDFYGCSDPAGYIAALRDMALAHGITVPLFACAGQGGIPQASGLADGVMPTCNYYPNDRDPDFEGKVLHYRELLGRMGYPLLVTETNRSHYLLRRLLSCGTKLLGPYLQVSGTDFGFTNATNNWGMPLAFMTSDYDFGGMISPEGHIREEAYEGRLLRRMMLAYGPALAEAETSSSPSSAYGIEGDAAGIAGPYALELKGGGRILFVTNLDDRDKEIALRDRATVDSPGDRFELKGGRSLALPAELPLAAWGMQGRLESSTAELYRAETLPSGTAAILFHAEGKGAIRLRIPGSVTVDYDQGQAEQEGDALALTFDGRGECRFTLRSDSGGELAILVHSRAKALISAELDPDGNPTYEQPIRYVVEGQPAVQQWQLSLCDTEAPAASRIIAEHPSRAPESKTQIKQAEPLESLGVYRGFAWYGSDACLPAGAKAEGLLLRQGSDIVSIYSDGRYVGTAVPGGGSRYISLDDGGREVGCLLARTEIWGHSNFDDIRLPGLRLSSRKGIRGIAAITNIQQLSGNWRVHRSADRMIKQELIGGQTDRSLWPVVGFGGWLSPDHPALEYYARSFFASADADSWTLCFEGLQARAKLFVGEAEVGDVNPFDPYVDITPYVKAGQNVELTVFLERALGLPAGQVTLYEGVEAAEWTMRAAEEPELLRYAEEARALAAAAELPMELASGSVAWLYAEANNSEGGKGWRVTVDGSGLKLTAFLEGRIVGRLWMPSGGERPVVTGGSQTSVYLPGAWFNGSQEGIDGIDGNGGSGKIEILLEAVDREAPGRLNDISFIPVQQSE
ncbi:beta-galactosidase [Paenibacillus sp. LHD-117]|uniref:beta-galactosidase n=1 Tax=Paenibacillus sp. LHD-117 TaxID=3071412 RepID=UPI0027E05B39|nr:beta-galactosidase [Paenibacillus sp. LHD-117]MDQ6418525.1 beta-galactosidase [Paenibacillus sp. LHD-117]